MESVPEGSNFPAGPLNYLRRLIIMTGCWRKFRSAVVKAPVSWERAEYFIAEYRFGTATYYIPAALDISVQARGSFSAVGVLSWSSNILG